MSIWTNKPSTPPPAPAPRPGGSGIVWPWSSKPAAKPITKPGILGEHGSSSFAKMKYFAKKQAYAPAPGYGRRIGKQEHMGMVDTLKKYAGQMYHESYGIHNEYQYDKILKQMEIDRKNIRYGPGYVEKRKKLDEAIKSLRAWKKPKN